MSKRPSEIKRVIKHCLHVLVPNCFEDLGIGQKDVAEELARFRSASRVTLHDSVRIIASTTSFD
jgi:hypothetical protein